MGSKMHLIKNYIIRNKEQKKYLSSSIRFQSELSLFVNKWIQSVNFLQSLALAQKILSYKEIFFLKRLKRDKTKFYSIV